MSEQRFQAKVVAVGTHAYVVLPFDPNEVWGAKERHYVSGTIDGDRTRSLLDGVGDEWRLSIRAAWLRERDLGPGATIDVVLAPEGPQIGTVAPDVAAALEAEPDARAFFESLATFYRNNFVRWIEEAKRPETRVRRIAEMVCLLKAGKRQR